MPFTRDVERRRARRCSLIAAAIKCGLVSVGTGFVITLSAAAADARVVTVTLSKMDISVQPVGEPFNVAVSIQKDQDGNVTLDIPAIKQTFDSSRDSPNFNRKKPFPSLWSPAYFGAKPNNSNTYVPLPDDYPLGGYIDTVNNNIPAEFRPTGGLPIKFRVASSDSRSVSYTGYIDNEGRLQFSAQEDFPVAAGTFATRPAHVTYHIGKLPDVTISNFQISLGASDSSKYNSSILDDMGGGSQSYEFDYGDFADITSGFYKGNFYTTWADNSAQLPGNSPNQPYKSYALAKYKVENFGRTFKRERIVNLSRAPGGEDLDHDYTYAEGGVTVDPADDDTIAVTYQQRKESRVGFVLSRSFDGGKTWTKKLLVSVQDHLESLESLMIPLRQPRFAGAARCGLSRTAPGTTAVSFAIRAT